MEILPLNILPYEKLEILGEESLNLEELLAIIIRTGTSKKTVFEISKEVLSLGENGNSLRFLQDITIQDLMKIDGIGKCKAIELKAVGEIAKRISLPIQKQQKITSNKDVVKLVENELKFEKREKIKIIIMDNKNKLLKIRNIGIGGNDYCLVEPKQILSEAVKLEAQKIILVHNHPSGDSTPSKQDYEVTKRIKKAGQLLGITLLDHIIIGDGNYSSIKI